VKRLSSRLGILFVLLAACPGWNWISSIMMSIRVAAGRRHRHAPGRRHRDQMAQRPMSQPVPAGAMR
jgi:hypothetical protein